MTMNQDAPNNIGFQTFDELRILKERGFYGITLPVVTSIPGTQAQTAANFTAPFFIANRPYQVLYATERHETAGTSGSAVTMQLAKVPSGTAPASGTNILKTAIDLKATANVNQLPVPVVGSASILNPGDALSLITTGTLTSLAGVTVSVLLKAV